MKKKEKYKKQSMPTTEKKHRYNSPLAAPAQQWNGNRLVGGRGGGTLRKCRRFAFLRVCLDFVVGEGLGAATKQRTEKQHERDRWMKTNEKCMLAVNKSRLFSGSRHVQAHTHRHRVTSLKPAQLVKLTRNAKRK